MFSFLKRTLLSQVTAAAKKWGVPFDVVSAIIWQESKGLAYAIRYEPAFFAKHIKTKNRSELPGYWPSLCSEETERRARTTSFGLMQILGQTAREMGFAGEFLTEICDVEINIGIGCKYLNKCIAKEGGDLKSGIARYNGSGKRAQAYAEKILEHISNKAYMKLYEGGEQ